ncbi:MAG: cell division protein FtsA [Rikenellaceae bacterium]
MTRKRYSIAIDLGESSVTVMAGYRGIDGLIEIAAIARRKTQGLKAGRIENIAQINGALSGAIAEIESKLEIKVCQAYGGISGEFVRCERHTETVIVEEPSSGVATTDVVALNNLMRDVLAPTNDTILESAPQNYMVDGRREVKDPVGSFCRSLSSSFNFTLCDREALKRLSLAFMQAGISLKRCFANSVVAAEAVVSNDEREVGVAVVDLGEGVTNIAIYSKGALRYMASIPIGGSAVNRDLRSMMVHENNVEPIKLKYGCAIADYSEPGSITIEGRTARERHNIPIYNIAVAIEQRLTDIAVFVQREIRDAGFEGRLPYGIVLCGGGANTRHIDDLFRHNLALEVRIATPENMLSLGSLSKVSAPEYATVIGLLRRAIELDEKGAGKSCTRDINDIDDDEQQSTEITPQTEPTQTEEQLPINTEPHTSEYERNGGATQTELNLESEEEEEEEEYNDEGDENDATDEYDEEDEEDEEEEREAKPKSKRQKRQKKSNSPFSFFTSLADKVNKLFSSEDEEKFD